MMKNKQNEIWDELRSVLSGSTIDTIIPPIAYALFNAFFGLNVAVMAAMILAVLLCGFRLIRKQPWQYALGGMLAVAIAAGLALLTRNAASYFIPAIISSALLLTGAMISLLIRKPMAAWVSHLTRGWPLDWFWRKDIKPAYLEVTGIWVLFFAMRLVIQVILFQRGATGTLAWANTLLGWPVTILVLIISYIFGVWRLRKLGGPGVEEFEEGKEPPWEGQTRGF